MNPLTPPSDLVLPDRAGPPLRGILPDIARAMGAELPDLPGAGLPLMPGERIVVVLVDGLGLDQLQARAGHAPMLRSMLREQPVGWAGVAAAGYPSTTAASLAAFGTGHHPGETGMLGYTVRDPRRAQEGHNRSAAGLVNLVSWTCSPEGTPPDPTDWQPVPTVFERLPAHLPATSIGRAKFAGSGLTRAALRGSRFVPAERLSDAVDATIAALRSPGLVYLYWGWLDHAGHQRGWESAQWGEALGELDAELAALRRRLPRGAQLVVTADHGMVDVTERLDVAHEPELRHGVELIAGEPRAMHLHLDANATPAEVVARWQGRLGESVWVISGTEAIDSGLFGPVPDRHRSRIGDVVAMMRGTTAVHDSRTQTRPSLSMVGMHGSLTHAELTIPALIAA